MTRSWHHRRLRVRPGGRRASAAARLRAHVLALGAWMACPDVVSGLPALLSPGEAVALRTRLALREALDVGWAAAARRWA
jgi:hypothetical protein